ncbi:MAG: hypothetical protein ABMA13_23230 [Chthoniobacteraceae bacterium]
MELDAVAGCVIGGTSRKGGRGSVPGVHFILSLMVVNGTGGFSGTFTHSPGKSVAYKGIVLNKGANKGGFGYFLSPPPRSTVVGAEGGSVTLTARP